MAIPQRLVILLGLLLSVISALAAVEKDEPFQFTALWLDARRPTGDLFVNDAKGVPQKLIVGVASRGTPVIVGPGGKPVVLLRKSPTPAANGAATYEKAGEVTWPSGGSHKALLLLAAMGKEGSPLTVGGVGIADDLTTFPVSSLRIVNFVGAELMGKVGNDMKPLPPGASAAIPYPVHAKPDSKAAPNFPVGVAHADKNGKPELIFNGWVDAWPNSRTLVLIFSGKTAEADPIVRTVVETVSSSQSIAPAKPKPVQ